MSASRAWAKERTKYEIGDLDSTDDDSWLEDGLNRQNERRIAQGLAPIEAAPKVTEKLSTRQLFDQTAGGMIHDRLGRRMGGGDGMLVFDEPEQGLSPAGQLKLAEQLASQVDGEIIDKMLVPTNNVVLFLSDLPRLDLEHPERGIHRPSEYGEGGEIQLRPAS
jgi:predicted ATPase